MKKVIWLLTVLLGLCQLSYASTDFKLLLISCNGEVSSVSEQNRRVVFPKTKRGNVTTGMLWGEQFFAVDSSKQELIATNMTSPEVVSIVNLQDALDNYNIAQVIGSIDNEKIYFSAYEYFPDTSINKQKLLTYIYEFNKDELAINKLPIHNCRNRLFSRYNNKLYYTGPKARIFEYANEDIRDLGLKGWGVSISPDGKKLAYISYGIINEIVSIYNLQTKEKTTIFKSFGPNTINPIIRWSHDSNLIAIAKQSDITHSPLYVIDIATGKVLRKYEKSKACNWFFINK